MHISPSSCSGLNSLVVDPPKDQIVPYAEFSKIPQPSVPGHIGRFVLGEIAKRPKSFSRKAASILMKAILRAKSDRLFAFSPKLESSN